MTAVATAKTKDCTPSSPEREAHLEWLGGRTYTLLAHYFRPDDPVPLTEALGRDWAKVLQDLSEQSIERACIEYLRDFPKRSDKPTPGAIYQRALKHEQGEDVEGWPTSTHAARLTFWAERLNSGAYVAASAINVGLARDLIDAGLVTPLTLKERGIAA